MSGGSFDYASDARSLDEIVKHLATLQEILAVLELVVPNSAACRNTAQLLSIVGWVDFSIQQTSTELGKVWHALEWWYSNDWSKERFLAAVDTYERNK